MPDELPIVCTLDAPALSERLAEIAQLGRDALIDAWSGSTQAQLRFAADAGVRQRVDAIVAAESQCCAFLEMTVTEQDDAVVVSIGAPEGADLVLEEMIATFGGQPHAAG